MPTGDRADCNMAGDKANLYGGIADLIGVEVEAIVLASYQP